MTGATPVPNRPALWAALSRMRIDAPGDSTRFEEALAAEQGWPLDFARRVTDEYRRFLYLAATAGFEVTPSQNVDEAWHLHLRSSHYDDVLCRQILGRPLEHRPANGEPGEAERHCRQYESTMALYGRAFLKPPPADIWPRQGPGEKVQGRLESAREQGGRLARRGAFATLLLSVPALIFGAPAIAAVLILAALLFILLSQPRTGLARDRNSGSCGAGCGGGGSSNSSDNCAGGGGASCGGGGCGGGGCGGD